jgi:hypothetical protein
MGFDDRTLEFYSRLYEAGREEVLSLETSLRKLTDDPSYCEGALERVMSAMREPGNVEDAQAGPVLAPPTEGRGATADRVPIRAVGSRLPQERRRSGVSHLAVAAQVRVRREPEPRPKAVLRTGRSNARLSTETRGGDSGSGDRTEGGA